MNIFFLDNMPEKNAQSHCDAHIRSGIIESICCLGFAYDKFSIWPHINNKNKHLNHNICVWTRTTLQNFDFVLKYSDSLISEFEYRFNKKHKCEKILDWIKMNIPMENLQDLYLTNPPRAFGKFKGKIEETNDVFRDYRIYYTMSKGHLFKWTKRPIPDWIKFYNNKKNNE